MESLIRFGIGKFELDWGKYLREEDYSDVFGLVNIDYVDSYAYDDYSEQVIPIKTQGYSIKLSVVKTRLDILGFGLDSLRDLYDSGVGFYKSLGYDVPLSYDFYYSSLLKLDLMNANTVDYEDGGGYDLGEYVRECIFKAPLFLKIIQQDMEDIDTIRFTSEFLENLDPRITLRILAENPSNRDLYLFWIPTSVNLRADLKTNSSDVEKIMIVTEGTSDLKILRRTIDNLYPDISDLFDYIDMEDNYPFTGRGSLKNFCIGLDRIRIRNNVIVLFDNDSAGCESYDMVNEMCSSSNLLIITLPNHPDFCRFCTIGPQGESIEDINGAAVSIECFLDFDSVDRSPRIRWKGYQERIGRYQGALEHKEIYQKAFFKSSLLDGSYNVIKLRYLIDYIIYQWVHREV